MQTLDFVSGLHNCLEFSQLLLISGYANTENVLYCLNVKQEGCIKTSGQLQGRFHP